MNRPHRLLGVLAGLTLAVAAAVPADATTSSGPDGDPVVVQDPVGDLSDLIGEPVHVPEARGLDLLRVRQVVRGNRLVIVSRHKNLTRRNANVDPDAVPVGGSFSLFSAYVEPRPYAHGKGYALSFDRQRRLTVQDLRNQAAVIPCKVAAARSRIDLEADQVRYVVPLRCIDGIRSTRTTVQVVRYKVVRRHHDGVEVLDLAALDQNDSAAPRLALR